MSEPGRQTLGPGRRAGPWIAWIGVVVGLVVGVSIIGLWALNFSFGPKSTLAPAPLSPAAYGTPQEIGTAGDNPNPRALYHGAFPSDDSTQERAIGSLPARFSGYTTWIRSATRVPARGLVPGYRGSYLRIHVTVFNRDTQDQHVCACDFYVWTKRAGFREADAVAAPTLAPDTDMKSGATLNGNVYLYVGMVPGPYYVVYNPDAHVPDASSKARGVWRATV